MKWKTRVYINGPVERKGICNCQCRIRLLILVHFVRWCSWFTNFRCRARDTPHCCSWWILLFVWWTIVVIDSARIIMMMVLMCTTRWIQESTRWTPSTWLVLSNCRADYCQQNGNLWSVFVNVDQKNEINSNMHKNTIKLNFLLTNYL